MFAPRAHRYLLREYLRTRVVTLSPANRTLKPDTGGGTGFHVVAPSGNIYIMTNRHVCNDAVNGKLWAVIEGVTSDHELKVVYSSDAFDLCLVEPIPGVTGITLGSPLHAGQEIYYLGHPRLQQSTFTEGESVGYKQLIVTLGVIGTGVTEDQCKMKDTYVAEQTELEVLLNGMNSGAIVANASLADLLKGGKKMRVCFEKGQAVITTMIIYAGASGSPMVDSLGKLVGVVYAAPVTGGWGYGVTLTDITTILNGR